MPRAARLANLPTGGQQQPKPWEYLLRVVPGINRPEAAVYWCLLQIYGPNSAGVVWFYQTPFAGGREFAGGAVMDFWMPQIQIGIRVQGTFWHGTPDKQASDLLQRAALEADGVRVVDISEDFLQTPGQALGAVRDALRGVSHSSIGAP
jgi:hypothetical protein